jgi:3-O-methylgallate 3,4-dioxygenase
MARLVAAFGSSHSPALNSPAEDMAGHARRDEQYQHHLDLEGKKVSYRDLLLSASPAVRQQIDGKTIAARVAACEKNLDRLAASIAAAELDALIVVGDDQHEQYFEENMPAFLVYCGRTIANSTLDLPAESPAYWKKARSLYHEPDKPKEYPVAVELGNFLVETLIESEFDIAYSDRLARPRGEGHAFGFVHRRLMADKVVPIVPVVVNTYYPPNQPTPGRCFALGKALRSSVEKFQPEMRVGILASGGLSHFTVDEALDRRVMAACGAGDGAALGSLPKARLNSGNSEIRNWIVMAGASGGLRTAWEDYVPLYRTPAGTGCGMGFMAKGP